MIKSSKKSNIQKYNFMKDRAIVKYILSHSQKSTIDYSKIKIPSFFDNIDTKEEEEKYIYKQQIFNRNKKYMVENENKVLEHISFPTFEFTTLKELNFGFINNNNESKIKSILFE